MKPVRFPTVSVIISTYNRPELLDLALDSVYSQTYRDYEVVVVDDATPHMEKMYSILEPWAERFADAGLDLLAMRLPENSGYQCVPKNLGIIHSNGDFIAYLDDDNKWLPEHLQVLMGEILKHDVDMVYGGRRYFNHTERTDLPVGDVPTQPYDLGALLTANYIDTSDILHSKGAGYWLAERDGFIWDESLRRFADWNLVTRWGQAGLSARHVDKILSEYHWHGDNLQLTRPVTEAPLTMSIQEYQRARVH